MKAFITVFPKKSRQFSKGGGTITGEIGPLEKSHFFYVKLSHKVSKNDPW